MDKLRLQEPEPLIVIPKSPGQRDEERVQEAKEKYGEGSHRHWMAEQIRDSGRDFRAWVDGELGKKEERG